MYKINNICDKLNVCMLGKTYDPSVFSYITKSKIRNILETLVIETSEDLSQIEKFLLSKNVEVLRPTDTTFKIGKKILPSMLTPRDHLAMIGDKFYMPTPSLNTKWYNLRGESWPTDPPSTFNDLNETVKQELQMFSVNCIEDLYDYDFSCFKSLQNKIDNKIVYDQKIDSAMYRLFNRKLYVGSWPNEDLNDVHYKASSLFPNYECIVIPSEGHLDGVMFIACEGLIFSSRDIDISFYNKVFPGWQIVYNDLSVKLNDSKHKTHNSDKWILKDVDKDLEFCNFIEHYFNTWTGDITESTFDVNMLFLDEKNIACATVNENNFKILEQHGITTHILPFRHIKFWDAGLHCLTADIDRGN